MLLSEQALIMEVMEPSVDKQLNRASEMAYRQNVVSSLFVQITLSILLVQMNIT